MEPTKNGLLTVEVGLAATVAAPPPKERHPRRPKSPGAPLAARAHLRRGCVYTAMVLVATCGARAQDTPTEATNELRQSILELKELPFEELVGQEITSVSRRPERLVNAPSAIQVITREDIHRSGASSLPEALRLAPNLQAAQINSHEWAISSRGFNSALANKLLVLIDGRTVYTPLFSGVFWDAQNVMLDDLDRIEVISGPGATLWGANAVNGVINIISKGADQTQGTLLSAGAGSFLRDFASLRYGDRIGNDLFFRVYGMGFERADTLMLNGHHANDQWGLAQGGFRSDWLPETGDRITFQGDFYGGAIKEGILGLAAPDDSRLNGQNLITRWTHPLADESDMSLQIYWDRAWRNLRGNVSDELNTWDADFQHRLTPWRRNRVTWGLGYRLIRDDVNNGPSVGFQPEEQTLELFSGFLQDELTLVEDYLYLTLGSKLEFNDYTGVEVQPSGRLAWTMRTNQTLWAAVSRAVRSPARNDTELRIPGTPPFSIRGNSSFNSETVLAYELGYRIEVSQRLGASIATFYNDYDRLASLDPIADAPGQFMYRNELTGETYGVELSGSWQAFERWRLRGGYTLLEKRIFDEGSQDTTSQTRHGNDPEHQIVLQSMVNLPANLELDSVLRYVDNLDQNGPEVPSYFSLDLRLGWRATEDLELSVVGQNLLDEGRAEFGPRALRREIPRSVYGKVTWKF